MVVSVFIDLKLALTAIFLTLLKLKCNVYLIFVIKMTKMAKARQSLQISHSRDSYASCTLVFVPEIWLKIRVEDVYLAAASMK